MEYPKALEDLIIQFMKYPGIGRKTAERYAMYTLNNFDQEELSAFSDTLATVKEKVFRCSSCGQLTDVDPCRICAGEHRDRTMIMVVESPKDVFSFERANVFHGLYHVLHGAISPINGIGPDDLNLASLWNRIQDEEVSEVILATSATQEGEATAMFIQRVLKNMDISVTRIGYGVPVGSNLEYADDQTLTKAVENRKRY